jgi:hypothetical protein
MPTFFRDVSAPEDSAELICMIVYGDPSYRQSFSKLLRDFQNDFGDASALSLDELRRTLVRAGQIEQAAFDACLSNEVLSYTMELTDRVASSFFAAWQSGFSQRVQWPECGSVMPVDEVLIKMPEGFSFYALFPESYFAAAAKWMEDHLDRRDLDSILVIGIRSIGTTLSALVAAALKYAGWQVHRGTVRPYGHPFDRKVKIPADFLAKANWFIVADEGPGLSGSSMASVASALDIAEERISFFPGHRNDPGSKASSEARRRWAVTRRYVASEAEHSWSHEPVLELLKHETEELLASPVVRVEDLSHGKWRAVCSVDVAVPSHFERPKLKMTTTSGRSILWKFSGFTTDPTTQAKETCWTSPILKINSGYAATEWREGSPMSPCDATPLRMREVGRYLTSVAGPPQSLRDATDAQDRLKSMAHANIEEVFGTDAARKVGRTFQVLPLNETRTYRDGRMASYEWILRAEGSMSKVDWFGNVFDHTIVGPQSILWDIAGAMIEWDVQGECEAALLEPLTSGGFETSPENLLIYSIAYCAFKMGQFSFCASISPPEEQPRSQREESRLRNKLAELIERCSHDN